MAPTLSHKHRILCVDDEIIGTTLRGEILTEHGYSVVLCHCPVAVLRCDISIFDLAVLDFYMPGLNGRELLLRMRALGARYPIVLLTRCLDALSYEDRVLLARCIDKLMPITYLLEAIAHFLDPYQPHDYGAPHPTGDPECPRRVGSSLKWIRERHAKSGLELGPTL
jgi:CheY-like chemotaxis protein